MRQAPSRAKARACERPMPRAAPVMKTTRSWKRAGVDMMDSVDTTDAVDGEVFDDEFFFDLFFEHWLVEDGCLVGWLFDGWRWFSYDGLVGWNGGCICHECYLALVVQAVRCVLRISLVGEVCKSRSTLEADCVRFSE